jgi:hypothetical protein
MTDSTGQGYLSHSLRTPAHHGESTSHMMELASAQTNEGLSLAGNRVAADLDRGFLRNSAARRRVVLADMERPSFVFLD